MAAYTLLHILTLSLLLLTVRSQIQTPPANISSGFVRFPNATKQTTWFYTQSGLVAYDGDIIFGTAAEFNNAIVNITYISQPYYNPPSVGRRGSPDVPVKRSNSFFPGSPGLWPGGTINYRYFDANTESLLSTYVDGAIAAWAGAVPCIKFVKMVNDNNPLGSTSILTIVAHNPNVGYCTASLGIGTGSLWMELDTGGGCGVPEVTHEFGHVLSLAHEQKRPDSNLFDPFICSNLQDYPFGQPSPAQADAQCCGQPPNFPCCGWACQFTPDFGDYNLQDPVGADGGTFDLNSIMLYRNDAFAKPGTFTLTGGPNDHNNPQSLSSEDILRIRELYGCLPPPPPPPPQCNAGCNPASGANTCSWPTAQDCVFPSPSTPNPRAACACRAGFKATAPGILDTDTTKQWRLPADEGNFRVWVAEGVPCDTLCDVPTGAFSCQEVTELPADCLHN